jgi:hypothetical protein
MTGNNATTMARTAAAQLGTGLNHGHPLRPGWLAR